MLALDPAHRARRGAHDDGFGRHHPVAAVLDAAQQRSVGHAGRGEDHVALGEVFEVLDAVEVVDPPFLRAQPLVVVAEQQAALELAADAAQRRRAAKWGVEDLDRVYDLEDLAKGDVIFAATGVTDGSLLRGVKHRRDGVMTTETVVMRASSGTVRWVKGEHREG